MPYYPGLGKCYKSQPSASANDTYVAFDNSKYLETPYPIDVDYLWWPNVQRDFHHDQYLECFLKVVFAFS